MTTQATLCFILRDNEVLLLKKSKGLFGEGKWNVPGGKILLGETARDCAIREVLEETRLKVKKLGHVGTLHFYKDDQRKVAEWTVYVFLSRVFDGTPVPGREGLIKWFDVNALPFDEMWEDDQYWSGLALQGRGFEGWFYYSGDFDKLVDHRIESNQPLASVEA